MEVECIYTAASVNRTPHCLAWSPSDDVIIFGACDSVAVAELSHGAIRIVSTLSGHTSRVNCVRWISNDAFISTSTDTTARIWCRQNGLADITSSACLKGHASSVTCADGLDLGDSFLIATAAADSAVKIWHVPKDGAEDGPHAEVIQTIPIFRSGFSLDLRIIEGPGETLFLVVSTDVCKIIVYTSGMENVQFSTSHQMVGHEDWVQSLAVVRNPNGLIIGSGGQDSFIRVWKISSIDKSEALEELKQVKDLGPEELIRQKQEVFAAGNKYFSVTLETILAGHEDKIYGLQWQQAGKKPEDLRLLSCSLDKTMIVWKFDPESGVWIETVRVGEVGGNTLGFIGCDFRKDCKMILGYNFTGALHFWKNEGDRWDLGVVCGGHHGPVEDLDWEKNGRYFVTVSTDQTTRVHAPWKRDGREDLWTEIARPQVHGHDLACLTMLPSHRFAAGAEEKIVRVFESTKNFLQNLSNLSKVDVSDEYSKKAADGASVPSLGLSNKAVDVSAEVVQKSSEKDRHVKDQYPDFYFTPELHQQPPPEESLFQNTLWPELQKLYGHGYEIFCLSSDKQGKVIASACKASKAEHAQVFLWDAVTWKLLDKLYGHSLTVIQMAFSPCDNYLLTASRDRTWSLFSRQNSEKRFVRIANTDKQTAIHQRLIWSCSWSSDSLFFCTASRDKKIAVWSKINEGKPSEGCLGEFGLACSAPITLTDSVTAVAFAPQTLPNGAYVIAAGLESGNLIFLSWLPQFTEEWQILRTLDSSLGHHKSVKRIRFSPAVDSWLVATCSTDHSSKLFHLKLSRT